MFKALSVPNFSGSSAANSAQPAGWTFALKKGATLLALVLGACLAAPTASASLIGDTLTNQILTPPGGGSDGCSCGCSGGCSTGACGCGDESAGTAVNVAPVAVGAPVVLDPDEEVIGKARPDKTITASTPFAYPTSTWTPRSTPTFQFSPLSLNSFSPQQVAGTTFSVTNIGFSAYSVDGVSNKGLTLERGVTYTFNISATGHPFYIKTIQGSGTGNQYTSGVTGNGTQSGTLTFTVPVDAPNTLFYDCSIHSSMTGIITIVPEPGAAALILAGLFSSLVFFRLQRRRLSA